MSIADKLKVAPRDDATAKVSGTSYAAQGHEAPEKATYNEVGSQYIAPITDPVPELSGRQAQTTYIKMYRSDVSVRASLRCGEGPVLAGDYNIEPYDDQPQSKAIKEFVEWNLFGAQTTPWLSFLAQVLKMYRTGFQVFEPVWELREWAPSVNAPGANRRLYTSLRKISNRPVQTISDIQYDDNGGPLELTQQAIGKDFKVREVKLPINKLLIFTFDKDGGDIKGESILRTAYPHWYYKQKLYAIDAVQKERHGIGVPEIELLPGFGPDEQKFAHELGRNLRTNERAYIVRTSLMNVGFAELSGNLVDALASAEHHDMQIMKNVLVQFLNAGITGGGGRATSATSMDMMMKAMRYIANYICDVINYYLIPQIVAYNFDTDQYPKLIVRNVGEAKDLQMWAAAMANLVNSEAIMVDHETENWLRRQVDVPKRVTPRPVDSEGAGPHDTKVTKLLQGSIDGTNGNKTKSAGGSEPTGPGSRGTTDRVKSGNLGVSPSSGA